MITDISGFSADRVTAASEQTQSAEQKADTSATVAKDKENKSAIMDSINNLVNMFGDVLNQPFKIAAIVAILCAFCCLCCLCCFFLPSMMTGMINAGGTKEPLTGTGILFANLRHLNEAASVL